MGIKLANNAISRLAANISNSATTISLVPGEGARFPALAAGDWFPATITNAAGVMEIVAVTGRVVDVLTVTRAQETTAASPFVANDRIELRLTAAAIDALTSAAAVAMLPPGTGPIPWSLPTEPTGWIFADGRTLLGATPYTALRAAYIAASFPHGQDGSGNPKIPDMRGRVAAGLDNMNGAAGRLTGATLGAGLGAQTVALAAGEMPVHNHGVSDPTHSHGISDPGHTHTASTSTAGSHTHTTGAWSNSGGGIAVSSTGAGITAQSSITSSSHAGHTHPVTINGVATGVSTIGVATGITTQNAGSGTAHNNVQPTLSLGYIIKT